MINKNFILLGFVFYLFNEGLGQSNSFFVNLGYGTANQPREWTDDIYRGNTSLELVIPESRHHAYFNFGKNIRVNAKSNITLGVGIRKEYFDSYSTYQNTSSATFSNYYSVIIPTSYQRIVRLSSTTNFCFGGGINFQLYNIFYKDGFNYSESRSTNIRAVNGNIVKDERTYYYLKQKAPYKIIPQGKISFGLQSKVNETSSLQTSFSLEADIIKSSFMHYYFEIDDRVNNDQDAYSAVSRGVRRVYFSVSIAYNFTFNRVTE